MKITFTPLITKKHILLFALSFMLSSINAQSYNEEFDIPNKGILSPGCTGADLSTCSNTDFSGVDWTLEGDFSGIDSEGVLTSNSSPSIYQNVLWFSDTDGEVCWVSPDLVPYDVTGQVVFIWGDFDIQNYDPADYVNIEYLEGSTWIQVPNQMGGGTHTIQSTSNNQDYFFNLSFNTTITTNTTKIRICVQNNTASEDVYLSEINFSGTTLAPLPVELTKFQAALKNNKVMLDWTTASELNNNYFEVQQSTDGYEFKTIGIINGEGTIEAISNYSFVDKRPSKGHNYYRLKQVDFDGAFEYSDVRVVNNETESDHFLEVFPNPSNGKFTLGLHNPNGERAIVKLFDSTGSIIWETRFSKGETSPYWEKQFELTQQEVYFVMTQIGVVVETKKVVVIDEK